MAVKHGNMEQRKTNVLFLLFFLVVLMLPRSYICYVCDEAPTADVETCQVLRMQVLVSINEYKCNNIHRMSQWLIYVRSISMGNAFWAKIPVNSRGGDWFPREEFPRWLVLAGRVPVVTTSRRKGFQDQHPSPRTALFVLVKR